MARARLLRLHTLVQGKEEVPSRSAALWLCSIERQSSSAACSTSYSHTGIQGVSREQSSSTGRAASALRSYYRVANRNRGTGEGCPEAYAEFTELQQLLHQYQRNLGAVGKAVTAFTEHLWERKGVPIDAHQGHSAENDREQLAATEEDLVLSIEKSDLCQLSDAVCSFVSLDQRPDSSILSAVASSLQRNIRQGVPQPHEIAEILSGLAALGYQPEPELLDSIADTIGDNLGQCSADDISSLMNSLAAYGRTHFPLMSKVSEAVISRGSEFESEALADLLYSFAILHFDAQHMVDSILERILFDLKSMSPAALSQLVSGLHLLNHRDAVTDVFLDALAEAALEQLQHFNARQLATLAYNYGTLNHWGRNDQELLDAITIRMLHQHQELVPSELANLVWAIARASHVSPRTSALLASVANHAAEVAEGFQPQQLARMLHSLAMLSFYHKPLFERAEKLILERMDDFAAEDLALIACAFARLMHDAPSMVPAIMQRLEGQFGQLSAAGLSGLIWGAAVLNQLSVPTFQAANQLLDAKNLQEFTAREFVRLFQAELLMEVKLEGKAPPPRLTEWLRGYAIRSLKDKLYLDRYAGTAQQEVSRCLMRLRIPYTLENVVDALLPVDIVLKIPDQPKVAIKVEQVSKYTTSRPQRPLADAVVTRRLLQARGWKLVCFSEHDWVRLKDFSDKLAFLDEKIKETLASPPALAKTAA